MNKKNHIKAQSIMSFPNNDKSEYVFSEETQQRVEKLARLLNCSEQEAGEGLLNSFLNLIENPKSPELTGFAKEAREKLYPPKH